MDQLLVGVPKVLKKQRRNGIVSKEVSMAFEWERKQSSFRGNAFLLQTYLCRPSWGNWCVPSFVGIPVTEWKSNFTLVLYKPPVKLQTKHVPWHCQFIISYPCPIFYQMSLSHWLFGNSTFLLCRPIHFFDVFLECLHMKMRTMNKPNLISLNLLPGSIHFVINPLSAAVWNSNLVFKIFYHMNIWRNIAEIWEQNECWSYKYGIEQRTLK